MSEQIRSRLVDAGRHIQLDLQTARRRELIFAVRSGGRLRRSTFRRRVRVPTVAQAGLPPSLRFHDLRHSYASWLISDGVPVNVVQRPMGHEQASTTLNRYVHAPRDYEDRVRPPVLGEGWC
jgi:integrase